MISSASFTEEIKYYCLMQSKVHVCSQRMDSIESCVQSFYSVIYVPGDIMQPRRQKEILFSAVEELYIVLRD